MDKGITIATLTADDIARRIGDLAALLHDCVQAGASVNFVQPFSQADSAAFWRDKVLPAVQIGTRIVLVAERNSWIAGSVQLGTDTPPNQPHRAEVTKLLVHPDARRRGIAKAMMAALERLASEMGRNLITLDTRTGDSAEPLYASLGYVKVGVIPDYSLDPYGTQRLDATTIMYKVL
jgi:ribosomal protein S18 acetylase RimI-like enzyme